MHNLCRIRGKAGNMLKKMSRHGRVHTPRTPQTETFLWDGLALVRRDDEEFINEPHVGNAPKKLRFEGKPRAQRSARRARKGPRGNPVTSSKGKSYFNDILGTTVGFKTNGKYSPAALSAFGERLDNVDSTSPAIRSLGEGWFTGKPYVEGLGHAFLMRNYRAGLAKWQTADPLGYPDGWNALAYGGNSPLEGFDLKGGEWGDWYEWNSGTMLAYYLAPWGPNDLDTDDMGFTEGIYDVILTKVVSRFKIAILATVLPIIQAQQSPIGEGSVSVSLPSASRYCNFSSVCWALGDGSVFMEGYAEYFWNDKWCDGHLYRYYEITTYFWMRYFDIFKDIFGREHKGEEAYEFGTPYSYGHTWSNQEIYQHGRMLLE